MKTQLLQRLQIIQIQTQTAKSSQLFQKTRKTNLYQSVIENGLISETNENTTTTKTTSTNTTTTNTNTNVNGNVNTNANKKEQPNVSKTRKPNLYQSVFENNLINKNKTSNEYENGSSISNTTDQSNFAQIRKKKYYQSSFDIPLVSNNNSNLTNSLGQKLAPIDSPIPLRRMKSSNNEELSLSDTIPAQEIIHKIGWVGFLSRVDSENLLRNKAVGTFLIRWSTSSNSYVLSFVGSSRQVENCAYINLLDSKGRISVTHENDEKTEYENLAHYIDYQTKSGLISKPIEVTLDIFD